MTKASRGKKLLHLSKNPYQTTKQTQPRGLALLQKQSGSNTNGNAPLQTRIVDNNNTDNKENGNHSNNMTVYMQFQELLQGLEIINNSFIYYSNTYLPKVITTIKDKDVDLITKSISYNDAIAIFLTLQTEYCFLYSNKVKNCNKYECDARTQSLFISKSNGYYAMYMFDAKLPGHQLFKSLFRIPKFRTMQYKSRFDLVCDDIQRNLINASKDFVEFVNDDLLKLNINANRENGYAVLDTKNFKGNPIDYSSDVLTKKNLLTIISNDWKISDESSKYKVIIQEAKNKTKIKINQKDKLKLKNKGRIITSPDTESSYSNLNVLCAVVSEQNEVSNDLNKCAVVSEQNELVNNLNDSLQHEHVNIEDSKIESLSAPPIDNHIICSNDKVRTTPIYFILTISIYFVSIFFIFMHENCLCFHA